MEKFRPVEAVIFDMDSLLIDSEPLWLQAEREIFSKLGLNCSVRDKLPDTLGLRIDLVVQLWYQYMPWQGASQAEISNLIVNRTLELVKQTRPILPGVEHALYLCRRQKLKIGLASASPCAMRQQVLSLFGLEAILTAWFQQNTSLIVNLIRKFTLSPQNN